jgi:mono/diheme cytochrome c family protein
LRKDALKLKGSELSGHRLFQRLGCAACHGEAGNGDIGPSLIKVRGRLTKAQTVDQLLKPRGTMPAVQPGHVDAQQLAHLVAFVRSLK